MKTLGFVSEEGFVMRPPSIVSLAVTLVSLPAFAQNVATQGSAEAIREVVSGKTCVGDDILKFGQSAPGSPGKFDRVGQPEGTYTIGYPNTARSKITRACRVGFSSRSQAVHEHRNLPLRAVSKQDPAMLQGVKPGGKAKFDAENVNGQFVVTKIKKGK
jgi:hypothetical protein